MVQFCNDRLDRIDFAALKEATEPVFVAHRVCSVEISHRKEPQGWVLRVVVESLEDAEPEGINVGLLSQISRDLSTALDVANLVPNAYTLEVSSPGIERPLRSLGDYERAKDSMVKIHLRTPAADGQRVLRGLLTSVDGEGTLTVEVNGRPVTAAVRDIERAHTVYVLPAQPKHKRPTTARRH